MTEKSPPAEAEVGTLTHNLFAAGPLIEGDHQLPKNEGISDALERLAFGIHAEF